jgi:hypothetical protein
MRARRGIYVKLDPNTRFCLRDAEQKVPKSPHTTYEVKKPQTRMTIPRAAIDSEAAMDVLTKTPCPFREGMSFFIGEGGHEALFSAPLSEAPATFSSHRFRGPQRDRSHSGAHVTVIRHFMFRSHSVTNKSRSGHISSHDITAGHISWQRLDRVDLGRHYKLDPDDMKPSARTPGMNSCLGPFHLIYRPFKVVDI